MKIRFYFDYSSPFAYLGATQIERVAAGHELSWEPFLLGGLFKAIGTANVPLFEMPQQKQAYQRVDMYRWAEYHGVPLRFPSRFPMMTVTALRMTLQLEGGDRAKLAHAVFRAYWVDDEDINDADVLRAVADAADVDGGALLTGCADPAVKALLHDATEAARAAGVCGAPSFAIDDGAGAPMLFWGQDRFELIERVLGGWRPRADQ